jgi:hypothetical protein
MTASRGKVTMRARAMTVARLRAHRISAALDHEGNCPGMDPDLRRALVRHADHIIRLTTPTPTAQQRKKEVSDLQRIMVEGLISQGVHATPAAIEKGLKPLDLGHKPSRRQIRRILATLRREYGVN